MQSVISCFNPTLFKKNLTRFWPIWVLYGVILVFVLPINLMSAGNYSGNHWEIPAERILWVQNYPLGCLYACLILSIIFGILAAMAVFSYLYSSRSVCMLHALPVRREALFLTNYLSGLCFLWLPNAAIFLLTLLVQAMQGGVGLGNLLLWLAAACLMNLFFYSFAVFCAMFTGNLLALPVFYGILNGLVYGLCHLFTSLARELLFGFSGIQGLSTVAFWLTPALAMYRATGKVSEDELGAAHFYGLGYLLVYTLAALALTAAALAVYRRRHLESAGDVVSVEWVRPVFKYGMAACSAALLGLILYNIFFDFAPRGPWMLLAFLLLSGVIGYFIAEMLLRKSFRVFRRGWKGCVVLLACIAAFTCCLEFDVVGFEGRVPSLERIESAEISYVHSAPYDVLNYTPWLLSDSDDLALLLQFHQDIVEHKDGLDTKEYVYSTVFRNGLDVETADTTDLTIFYRMKDGGYVERSYTLPITEEALADPDSYAALLSRLINTPTLIEDGYFGYLEEGSRLIDIVIADVYNEETGQYDNVYADSAMADDLLEAIHADIAAGRLGRRYLLNDEARQENCYLSDLRLEFRTPEQAQNGQPGAVWSYHVFIGLEASASSTLEVLRAYGVFGENQRLITHAEASAINRAGAPVYTEDVPVSEIVY